MYLAAYRTDQSDSGKDQECRKEQNDIPEESFLLSAFKTHLMLFFEYILLFLIFHLSVLLVGCKAFKDKNLKFVDRLIKKLSRLDRPCYRKRSHQLAKPERKVVCRKT